MDERVARLESEIRRLDVELLLNGLRLRAIDTRYLSTAHLLEMRAHSCVAGTNHSPPVERSTQSSSLEVDTFGMPLAR